MKQYNEKIENYKKEAQRFLKDIEAKQGQLKKLGEIKEQNKQIIEEND